MALECKHIHKLIDKLEALSPERVAEVEDFIDFIQQRDQGRQLSRAPEKSAEPAFTKVWDNQDDAVYDQL